MLTHYLCGVTVKVEAGGVFHLGFKADLHVGYGIHGEALVEDNQRTLHEFELKEDGAYTKIWHRQLPQGIESSCRKAVTASHNVVLQDGKNSPTLILNLDGSQLLDTLQHEGDLFASIPTGLVYRVGDYNRGYELVTVRDGGEVSRLQPEAGRKWSDLLSVCQDELGRTAVIDKENHSLDVFSGQQRKSFTLQHSYSLYC